MKSWGKQIWEEKAKFQTGLGVSGGVTSVIRGKKIYYKSMGKIQELLNTFFGIKKKRVKNILEVGPGPDAINTEFFLNEGYNLDVVDVSKTVLEKIKKKFAGKHITFFNQDIIDLKIKKRYDLIFSLGTFLHIPQHLSLVVMNNFKKHLKRGGYLLIDLPGKSKMTLKKAIWEGFYALGHKIKDKISKGFYVTCAEYSLEEIKDILGRTGFKVIAKREGLWLLKKVKNS